MSQRILPKIEQRSATISILGLGYVGLPLAVLFVKAGFSVIGFDINPDYINRLEAGVSPILDVPSADLQATLATGRLQLTSQASELRPADIHIICVPTPLSKTRQPDMSCIESALATLVSVWEHS